MKKIAIVLLLVLVFASISVEASTFSIAGAGWTTSCPTSEQDAIWAVDRYMVGLLDYDITIRIVVSYFEGTCI